MSIQLLTCYFLCIPETYFFLILLSFSIDLDLIFGVFVETNFIELTIWQCFKYGILITNLVFLINTL